MAASQPQEAPPDLTAAGLAEALGGRVEGDGSARITGISGLLGAEPGDVSFVADKRYTRIASETRATCLIVPESFELPDGCSPAAVVRVPDIQAALSRATEIFAPPPPPRAAGVHPTAVVGDGVEMGENVSVGAHAVIEDKVRIGANTTIGPHVFLGYEAVIGEHVRLDAGVKVCHRCRIGNRVILHPGVVIGGDGFGYAFQGRGHVKIPQIGTVVIEDDVEIGSNSTVDRARFGATRIGRGTKIDNLVMVAHNVQIGEHCIITGQCGLAGSAALGDYVMLGAKAGLAGHVRMGDRSIAAGRAGVSKDVPPGGVVMGMPAEPAAQAKRVAAASRKLPELLRTVHRLVRRVDALERKQAEEEAEGAP